MSTEVVSSSLAVTFGPVRLVVAEGVATVLVDSPPVNAMGEAVLQGLEDAARWVAGSLEVRVVVLTGGGTKAFMAGADIAEFEALRARPDGMREHSAWAGGVLAAWSLLPQPVIAAVQASAVGGGLEIAMSADLILTEPTAKFGLPEVKLGLIPGGGGTQRLPRRVGRPLALKMMLLGSVISAAAAVEVGLVDEVTEPGRVVAEAQVLAARIAAMPRVAVQALKRATSPGLAEALLAERQIFLEVAGADDFREGLEAFIQKRPPVFTHH